MADSDDVLQGLFIGGFAFVGVVTLVICLRKKATTYSMKKSASMEELNSVDTVDPIVINH
jgi:hypothetical protein